MKLTYFFILCLFFILTGKTGICQQSAQSTGYIVYGSKSGKDPQSPCMGSGVCDIMQQQGLTPGEGATFFTLEADFSCATNSYSFFIIFNLFQLQINQPDAANLFRGCNYTFPGTFTFPQFMTGPLGIPGNPVITIPQGFSTQLISPMPDGTMRVFVGNFILPPNQPKKAMHGVKKKHHTAE